MCGVSQVNVIFEKSIHVTNDAMGCFACTLQPPKRLVMQVQNISRKRKMISKVKITGVSDHEDGAKQYLIRCEYCSSLLYTIVFLIDMLVFLN
jgi:hypothetical protein